MILATILAGWTLLPIQQHDTTLHVQEIFDEQWVPTDCEPLEILCEGGEIGTAMNIWQSPKGPAPPVSGLSLLAIRYQGVVIHHQLALGHSVAEHVLVIPNDPSLIGIELELISLVDDPDEGLRWSDAAILTIE